MLGTAEVYIPTTKDYLDIVFRRRWPYVLGMLIGILLVLFMQSRQLATYDSEALVFVQERSKSTTFVAGLSRTSTFTGRWQRIQHLIFNKNTIKHHTEMFSGITPYHPPHADSLEAGLENYLKDENRYAVKRRVPYDLYHDRYVSLTPYQWWMAREKLDELGWVPPVSEQDTKRQIKNRIGIAHWFWVNVFNPMEKGLGWPIEDNRMIKGNVKVLDNGEEMDARLGEIVDVGDKSIISDIDRAYARQMMIDGRFNDADLSTEFLAGTTLTNRDLELIQSKSFIRNVEMKVKRALIPDGFKVSFTWNNPRITRFVVAWTTEMIFRFNEYYQHKEIFESQDLLENQLEKSLEEFHKIQNKVSTFLEKNVDRFESALSRYMLNPEGTEFPTVSQYQPPESTVRKAYNRTVEELDVNELRLVQARIELASVSRQLNKEDPEVQTNIVTTNPDYVKFQSELLSLENERRRELFTKTKRHPHVVELTDQINALRATLKHLEKNVLSESTIDINPRYRDLKEQRDRLETEIASREQSVEQLRVRKELIFKELKEVPAIEQRILRYKSELLERQQAVTMLQQRINQAKTEEQFTFALAKVEYTIKIPPTLPDTPEEKIWIHIGMAIVLFIFVSGITIFFCEFLDVTVKEINDVNRYLDAQVIGVIPKIPKEVLVAEKRQSVKRRNHKRGKSKRSLVDRLLRRDKSDG